MPLTDAKLQILLPQVALQDHIHTSHSVLELSLIHIFDDPLEYARLYLDGNLQMWVDAEDSLDIF